MTTYKPWPHAGSVWVDALGHRAAVLRTDLDRNKVILIYLDTDKAFGVGASTFYEAYRPTGTTIPIGVEGVTTGPLAASDFITQSSVIIQQIADWDDRLAVFDRLLDAFDAGPYGIDAIAPHEHTAFLMGLRHAVAAYLRNGGSVRRLPAPQSVAPGAA